MSRNVDTLKNVSQQFLNLLVERSDVGWLHEGSKAGFDELRKLNVNLRSIGAECSKTSPAHPETKERYGSKAHALKKIIYERQRNRWKTITIHHNHYHKHHNHHPITKQPQHKYHNHCNHPSKRKILCIVFVWCIFLWVLEMQCKNLLGPQPEAFPILSLCLSVSAYCPHQTSVKQR